MRNYHKYPIEDSKPPQHIKTKEEVHGVTSKNYRTPALDEQIDTMMYKDDKSTWTCITCGKKQKQKGNIRQHVETNHIEGISHPCDQCGKLSRYQRTLNLNVLSFQDQKCFEISKGKST